jgi:cell division protease FtsH
MLLGGRTAEELIFGDPTTGASNDIEKATQIARAMVTEFGMSDALGPQQLGRKEGEVFLGRDYGHEANYSEEVASRIDAEVRRLIDNAHAEAREILTLHRATLDRMADALIERETLDDTELAVLFEGLDTWKGRDPLPPEPPALPLTPPPVAPVPVVDPLPAGAVPVIEQPEGWLRRLRVGWRSMRRAPRPGTSP